MCRCVVGMEMKPLNGDQKGAEAAQSDQADTSAGTDATVVVLDGRQKRYPSCFCLPSSLILDGNTLTFLSTWNI